MTSLLTILLARSLPGCRLWLATAALSQALAVPPPPFPGTELFEGAPLHQIRIGLGADALASLRQQPRDYVRATVQEGTNAYEEVALHLKGAVGSFRPLEDKPSLTLDFGRWRSGQRFHGLRKVHLNNSVEDPSYLNEQLGSELFRTANVPAARVTHARVVLNGRALGLYVLKEGFTEDFLACHFKRVGSELYEPEGGHDVDQQMKRASVLGEAGNRAALKALAAAAKEPDLDRRWQLLEETLDIDRFLRFMAMEVMLGHRDGYCLARNNFRLYHDLDTDRMVFFPHGMDQLLGQADLPWQPNLAGVIAKAVMDVPEGTQRYSTCFRTLYTECFNLDPLTNRVEQLARRLRPFLNSREWAGLREEASRLQKRLVLRHANLMSQLSRPAMRHLAFEHCVIQSVGEWQIGETPAEGAIDQTRAADGLPTLHILAQGDTLASWRTKAAIPPGYYRFEGRARVTGVTPLKQGAHQGANLRIGQRAQTGLGLIGDSPWRTLMTEFQVKPPGETIEFICELRAQAGETWFDPNSLKVTQVRTYEDQGSRVHTH